jgi:Polysaccharide pyruvyl transferase.
MKVGIVTLVGNNYGNRLQNYALQEFVKSLDNSIKAITFKRNYSKNVFLGKCKHYIKRLLKPDDEIGREINNKFEAFNGKYLQFASETIYKARTNKELNQRYDYFIAGSDQVWNPEYSLTSGADFMIFADPHKRISYAASLGVTSFANVNQDLYRKWISGVKAISVREEQGKKAIEELTGKECFVHIDPTMLLSKSQWERIEVEPKWYHGEKFILKYFLGTVSQEANVMMHEEAEKSGLRIINVYDPKQGKEFIHDPAEFIWLIHHAVKIYTDSFHGSIFSLIFSKSFIVYERLGREINTGSRIETLLSKFDLYNKMNSYITVSGYDTNRVAQIIEQDRCISKQYLLKTLNLVWNFGGQ